MDHEVDYRCCQEVPSGKGIQRNDQLCIIEHEDVAAVCLRDIAVLQGSDRDPLEVKSRAVSRWWENDWESEPRD